MTVRTILIADTDPDSASALAVRLARLGYEVTPPASSAEQAVTIATTSAPDVVLMASGLATSEALVVTNAVGQQRSLPVLRVEPSAQAATAAGPPGDDPTGSLRAPYTDRELRGAIELALCRHDALRIAREMEDRFFVANLDMLCFLDFNGHFRRLNPAWERTLGFTREELMARPFIEFVHPDDRERTLRQNAEVRAGGQAVGFENRYLCKDGSFRWFLWNAVADVDGHVVYSVARDVTARKQAEVERERLVGELQTALAEVKVLQQILPICSYCRKVRDDENYWLTVEGYIARHTTSRFSHGICPSCMESEVEPELGRIGA